MAVIHYTFRVLFRRKKGPENLLPLSIYAAENGRRRNDQNQKARKNCGKPFPGSREYRFSVRVPQKNSGHRHAHEQNQHSGKSKIQIAG